MPFLLASSLDPVEEVLVIRNALSEAFVAGLAPLVAAAGARLRALDFDVVPHDLWIQDAVEIGRWGVPGGETQLAVLAGLRAKHSGTRTAPLDCLVRAHFEARGARVFDLGPPREGTRWVDWYGNLEVSPPVTDRAGRAFPWGRVLTGAQHGLTMHPGVLAFLAAQGVQTPPLVLDVSWLLIGHVDEVVNFVPAPGTPGFRVLLPSPALARALLEALVTEGHGALPVFAGTDGETTAQRLLDEVARSEENRRIDSALAGVRAQLAEGLGLAAEHFLSLPALFQEGEAVIPNPVNSLVCNGHVIVPDPHGPQVDGEDRFAAALRAALGPLGLQVHFLDDWHPYHVRAGEIHCGTNAIRRLGGP